MAQVSLSDVTKQLTTQNDTLGDIKSTLAAMLAEDVNTRKQQERAAGDREEARRKSQKEERKAQTTSGGSSSRPFSTGLLGGELLGGIDKGLSMMFGVIGGLIPSLLKGAGRGLRFGLATVAINEFAQGALDYAFDNLTFDDSMSAEDKQKLKKQVGTGINTGMALRFMGFRGTTSLGAAIGTAFGDDIANVLKDWIGSNLVNVPNPLAIYGIGPENIAEDIDLNNPLLQNTMGAAAGMIGASMIRLVGGLIARQLGVLTVVGFAALMSKMGFNKVSDFLKSRFNLSSRLDAKGATPPKDAPRRFNLSSRLDAKGATPPKDATPKVNNYGKGKDLPKPKTPMMEAPTLKSAQALVAEADKLGKMPEGYKVTSAGIQRMTPQGPRFVSALDVAPMLPNTAGGVPQSIKGAKWYARWLKIAKVIGVAATAIDVVRAHAVITDKTMGIEEKRTRLVAILGGNITAWGGAILGALAGGAMGGPWGAAGGGIAGAILGGFAGEELILYFLADYLLDTNLEKHQQRSRLEMDRREATLMAQPIPGGNYMAAEREIQSFLSSGSFPMKDILGNIVDEAQAAPLKVKKNYRIQSPGSARIGMRDPMALAGSELNMLDAIAAGGITINHNYTDQSTASGPVTISKGGDTYRSSTPAPYAVDNHYSRQYMGIPGRGMYGFQQ